MKDKLFFYGAQEWVNFFQLETRPATVPTEAMRRGDFSELLNANNGFYPQARVINDPLTGQPFPGNIIPSNRLSPNGVAILNAYPLPTPGFRQGTDNVAPDQRERAGSAQGQHPSRLPAEPDQPADLSLLAVVVHRPEPLRR